MGSTGTLPSEACSPLGKTGILAAKILDIAHRLGGCLVNVHLGHKVVCVLQ